ncbi:MAG: 3-deoxy-D-manno-octulosonic acid transferase [Planctomycetota bacterium]|nr:MAG: 3-deoxy-D-manno-octulosonic acid transferase [Planctomycetota bacterium]
MRGLPSGARGRRGAARNPSGRSRCTSVRRSDATIRVRADRARSTRSAASGASARRDGTDRTARGRAAGVWLYDLIYLLAAVVSAPVLAYLLVRRPRIRDGVWERLGRGLPRRDGPRRCVWIHGVSVGEVLGARPLVAELRRRFPELDLAVSTTTGTGFAMAQRHYGEHTLLRYPIDVGFAVRRALDAIRPAVVVLVEGEIWPNFLAHCRRRSIPVVLVNGRMTERSFRGYRRLRWLLRPGLDAIRLWCAQSGEYAERYRALGIPAARVLETGSLKYDALLQPEDVEQDGARYRSVFGVGEAPVLVAGSTHEGEERAVLEAYAGLCRRVPALRLVIVPRHLERVVQVQRYCQQARFVPVCKTAIDRGEVEPARLGSPETVFVVDTIGELARLYAMATVVFVGGSLVRHGGQNVLEPAGLGKPVVVGPHTYNFRAAVALLREADAIVQIGGAEELEGALGELLENEERARAVGDRARAAVEARRGAARRTVDAIARFLPPAVVTAVGEREVTRSRP